MNTFRIVFSPTLPDFLNDFTGGEVLTREIAEIQLEVIANYTLHLHETSLMPPFSNAGCIEELIDGEWVEIVED